jgi:hypothetical protein
LVIGDLYRPIGQNGVKGFLQIAPGWVSAALARAGETIINPSHVQQLAIRREHCQRGWTSPDNGAPERGPDPLHKAG